MAESNLNTTLLEAADSCAYFHTRRANPCIPSRRPAARDTLLKREKELTRAMEQLHADRPAGS